MSGWSARAVIQIMASIWLSWLTACNDPGCPHGFYQVGKTCYRFRDAEVDEDAETDSESDSADAGSQSGDAATSIADARTSDKAEAGTSGAGDAGSMVDAAPFESAEAGACSTKCGLHETCSGAACVCADGYSTCEPGCTDLQNDAMNCGACGYACEKGLSCKSGKCEQKLHDLVLGGDSSCVLFDAADGAYPIKCWGNTESKLFRDASMEALTPRSLVGVPTVRALALDSSRQCAVLPGRDVTRCWGYCDERCGSSAGFGLSTSFFDNETPAVTQVSVAATATCVQTSLRVMSCWGDAAITGSDTPRAVSAVTMVGGQTSLGEISLGGTYGCAVAPNGGVVCWGVRGSFVFGADVTKEAAKSGVFVTKETGGELNGVVHLAAGDVRACAVTQQGELWCWGENGTHSLGGFATGSLGVGDQVEHAGAVQVPLRDVLSVALGLWHTCALVRSGQVYCWGTAGLVGRDVPENVASGNLITAPQAVPNLSDALNLRAGRSHTCALRRSGQVVCWGANAKGQLGDGTAVTRVVPTAVVGLY